MKKLLIVLLTIVLFIPLNTYSISNTNKEEVIYVSNNLDGSINGVYVVNGYSLEKDDTIIDYGSYKNIINLTNTNDIKVNDDMISINASKGKFFYQGDSPDKELPWIFNFKYYLDNKEIDPLDLAGKSGTFKIVGSIKPNPLSDSIFSDYFLIQASFSFDSNKVNIIKADDATDAYNGSVRLLNYTVLPSSSLDFEIVGSSEAFEMNSIQISAVPFNMNYDLSQLESLSELELAIKKLNAGVSKINSGGKELNKSTILLYDNLKKITNGVFELNEGELKLSEGSSLFNTGLFEYSKGINTLVNKLNELGSGMDELKSGLVLIDDSIVQLADGSKKYKEGLSEYLDGVSQLNDGQKQFVEGLSTMASESNKLIEGGNKLASASQQISDGLSIFDGIDLEGKVTLEDMEKLKDIIDIILSFWNSAEANINTYDINVLIDSLNKSKDILESIKNILLPLKDSFSREAIIERLNIENPDDPDVSKLIDELVSVGEFVKVAIDNIDTALNNINATLNDVDKLEELFNTIKSYLEQGKDTFTKLKTALENYDSEKAFELINNILTFNKQFKKFNDGLQEYTQGVNSLVGAINNELLPGAKKISDGLDELDKNSDGLLDGIQMMIDGEVKIDEGLKMIIEKLDFSDLDEVKALKDGIDLLLSSHSELLNGEKELSKGLNQLSNGLGQYLDGFSKYSSGINEFSTGLSELNYGTNLLESNTSGMSEKIDEALGAFVKEGFELRSFVDDKNTNISHLQFVFVTDSISITKEIKEEVVTPKKSFFEKLLDLFR